MHPRITILGIVFCAAIGCSGEMPLSSTKPEFSRALRLCMLLGSSSGEIRAGIVNSLNNKSYILQVGECKNGVELLDVDYYASEVTLRKGQEIVRLKMEDAPRVFLKGQPPIQPPYLERQLAYQRQLAERRDKIMRAKTLLDQ